MANKKDTFAKKVLDYYADLAYDGKLPDQISLLNPFKDNEEVPKIAETFYHKYYNDHLPRKLILGINPGRLGAGSTGIPFTDTKRLQANCGIAMGSVATHEPSSVFIYEMITAFGGPQIFYNRYYINSVCPLGFTITNENGKEVNYNYYDRKDLQDAVHDFIKWNIQTQIDMGCEREVCYCLGTGKNFQFLHSLNESEKYFDIIVPLEHPRYVMQYKSKSKDLYVDQYLKKLT